MRYGFTLIETFVVIALSTAMFGALTMLIYSFNTSYSYEQAAARSAGSARAILREAESLAFVANHVLQSHSFSGMMRTSSSTVLVLEIPSVDSSGNIISGAYDYAVFYVDGARAYRLLEANAASSRVSGTKQLSDAISSLAFSYNNADFALVDAVTVDVQTFVESKEQTNIDRRREQLYLRNF